MNKYDTTFSSVILTLCILLGFSCSKPVPKTVVNQNGRSTAELVNHMFTTYASDGKVIDQWRIKTLEYNNGWCTVMTDEDKQIITNATYIIEQQ